MRKAVRVTSLIVGIIEVFLLVIFAYCALGLLFDTSVEDTLNSLLASGLGEAEANAIIRHGTWAFWALTGYMVLGITFNFLIFGFSMAKAKPGKPLLVSLGFFGFLFGAQLSGILNFIWAFLPPEEING